MVTVRPALRRRTLGLFLVLLATVAARAAPVAAGDDPIKDTVSDPTDPIKDTVSVATDPIKDTVSDATDPIKDTVSDATDPIRDTVSDATDPINDAVSDATDRTSEEASTHDTSSTSGTGTSQRSARDHTSSRQENDAPAATGGGISGAMERILTFLAQTGWTLLPWIVVAGGLTAVGIFLLRLSRHRTSRS